MHGDILGERARLSPDKTALVFVPTGERFTYRELDARAARCAAVWRSVLGLAKGDRIGILAPTGWRCWTPSSPPASPGWCWCLSAPASPAGSWSTSSAIPGCACCFYDGAFAETAHGVAPARPARVLDPPRHPSPPKTTTRWAELLSRSPVPGPRSPVSPEDVYCLLYTSGTTGKPKGVMIPHRMVAWNGYNTVACWQLREDDVSPIFTPLYHAGGLGAFLVPIFTIGGTIVLHAGFDAAEVWRTIERERCTVVLGVPTIYKLLMEAPEFADGRPRPRALADQRRRAAAALHHRGLPAAGRRLQAGLRSDRGRRELLLDDASRSRCARRARSASR